VNKGGTSQTVGWATWTKLTWSIENFDTNNNFANSRFTPTVAGKYIINVGVVCDDTTNRCHAAIFKNGVLYKFNISSYSATGAPVTIGDVVSSIVDMNGTTDFIEAFVYSNGNTIRGAAESTYFDGSLLGP
jgi:hypothetical protein